MERWWRFEGVYVRVTSLAHPLALLEDLRHRWYDFGDVIIDGQRYELSALPGNTLELKAIR